jgi:hypothetical protein
MKHITIYLQRTSMACSLFPNYDDCFVCFFSSYILLFFIARFVGLDGLVYCDCNKVGGGGKAGFRVVEGVLGVDEGEL